MTRKAVGRVRAVTTLVLIMAAIGVVTVIATINTFEVIFRHDTSLSDVIINVELTSDDSYDKVLMSKESQVFDEGHFGTPRKIKFPESRIHYDVTSSQAESSKWKATKGLAHYFVTENPVQKVFGGAVIYMRENTPTTHDIGSIMNGDIINIVTTEGWQLGYEVRNVTNDPSLLAAGPNEVSTIDVILVDELSGDVRCFDATLLKVGERI